MSIKAGGLTLKVFCLWVCTTYPGFSTTLTNCVFQGRKQILSNSSRQTKKKENETFDFIFSIMRFFSRQWSNSSPNGLTENISKSESNGSTFKSESLQNFSYTFWSWFNYQQLHQSSNGLPNGLTDEINLRLLDIW